jgi:hypothetical protein
MVGKEKIMAAIVELELEMFLAVPADGSYSCQQDPAGFRLHRKAQFSIWSEDTLQSYLDDLNQAKADDFNLMTIKYGRMQNIIPRENFNPLIEDMLAVQSRWQAEMIQKYPHLMAGARHQSQPDDSADETSFETYLKGELETYSDATLALLYRDILQLVKAGVNGSEKIYDYLVKEMGYDSLTAADRAQT